MKRNSLIKYSSYGKYLIFAVRSIGGFLIAYYSINARMRARNGVESVIKYFLISASIIAIFTTFGIVFSVFFETISFFQVIPASSFFFGTVWDPRFGGAEGAAGDYGQFGFLPLLWGTLYISIVALIVAVPIGLYAAIYMSEYAGPKLRSIAKPALEILAGIPTIVYGFFALSNDKTCNIPIILLTARGEESDRIRGLSTGADDYVTKPFPVPELIARVKAVLRRANPESIADVLTVGDVELDRSAYKVKRGPREVRLGPIEFKLLEFLMESPGRVYSRSQLLDSVWGQNVYVDERSVDVHIGRLRKALNRGNVHDTIRTVRGAGYSISDQSDKVPARA